jgi:hypothetical protein
MARVLPREGEYCVDRHQGQAVAHRPAVPHKTPVDFPARDEIHP